MLVANPGWNLINISRTEARKVIIIISEKREYGGKLSKGLIAIIIELYKINKTR